MTDARADALTAHTTDPGIVAALVYVGDQIAAIGAGSHRTAARTSDSPDREPVEGSRSTGAYVNGYRVTPAQHPIDRHLLPKEN